MTDMHEVLAKEPSSGFGSLSNSAPSTERHQASAHSFGEVHPSFAVDMKRNKLGKYNQSPERDVQRSMSDFEFGSEPSSPQRNEAVLDSDTDDLEGGDGDGDVDRSLSFGRRLADFERALNAPESSTDAFGGKSQSLGDREMAIRTKLLEAKWHEEKLSIQQRHDAAIRKILGRKNAEIETVKQYYRGKLKDADTLVERLEERMRTLLHDVQVAREQKDKQMQELRKQAMEASAAKQREFDARLKETYASFEADKRALETEQQIALEELRRETAARLREVEADCVVQREQHTSTIGELRSRLDALTLECDSLRNAKQAAERDCTELAQALTTANSEKESLVARYGQLEAEYARSLDAHRDELSAVQKKYDATLAFIREEREIETSKLSASVNELDEFVAALRRDLGAKDAEFAELRRARDADRRTFEETNRQLDEQLRTSQRTASETETELRKRVADLKNELRDALAERTTLNEQLARARAEYDDALRRARADFDTLAQRTSTDQAKRVADLDTELVRERAANERLVREQERATSELRDAFEQELASLRSRADAERCEAVARLGAELEALRRSRDTDAESHRNALHAAATRFEERIDEVERRSAKRAGELETTIRSLREELTAARSAHQKALADAETRVAEAKTRATREMEAERLRIAERQAAELRDTQKKAADEHSLIAAKLAATQTELTQTKENSKKAITELKAQINELKSDLGRVRETSEQRCTALQKRADELMQALGEAEHTNQELREELMRYHENELSIEKHLLLEDEKYKEMIRELREQYEARMQGLLPANLQRDLEETIMALKSQVVSLQQRTSLLQDELGFARSGGMWNLPTADHAHAHAHTHMTGSQGAAPLYGARSHTLGHSNPMDYYRLPVQGANTMALTRPAEHSSRSETTANIGATQPLDGVTLRAKFGSTPTTETSQLTAAGKAGQPASNTDS